MRVVCPSCGAAYNVPDVALGTGAKRLRCARCQQEWLVDAAPAPAAATADRPPVAQARPDPGPMARLADAGAGGSPRDARPEGRPDARAMPPITKAPVPGAAILAPLPAASRPAPVPPAVTVAPPVAAVPPLGQGPLGHGPLAAGPLAAGPLAHDPLGIPPAASPASALIAGVDGAAMPPPEATRDDPAGQLPSLRDLQRHPTRPTIEERLAAEAGGLVRPVAAGSVVLAWLLSFAVLGMCGAAAVIWRADVIRVWPPSERVYLALGLQ